MLTGGSLTTPAFTVLSPIKAALKPSFLTNTLPRIGDEDLKAQLEVIASSSTPTNYTFPSSLLLAVASKDMKVLDLSSFQLYNRFEGELDAWQLNESYDSFLKRLRPSTSTIYNVGPWIWVENPHIPPPKIRPNMQGMIDRCQNILSEVATFRTKTEKELQGKPKSTISRKLNPKRNELPEAIARAAVEAKCTSGKWMLFPPVGEVDAIWRTVVEETIEGRFGPTSKVATDGGDGKNERLICVYTKDFSDKADVRRVLDALVNVGLVRDDGAARSIWYKSDVYTHMNINSDNEYGLKASIYGSATMLKEAA